MKNNSHAGKNSRTKIFTVITATAVILLLALNLWVSSFGIFGNAYIDMTPEGLYTLTPKMVQICREVFCTSDGEPRDPGITITFCNDPDYLIDDVSTRLIYYMAIALSKKFDNCEVETVNVKMNPTTVAKYKTTSLTDIKPNDVIISYGSRLYVFPSTIYFASPSRNMYISYESWL